MSDTQRLHHLLDRARRGVLLPAEGEQLAGLVGELEAEITQVAAAAAHAMTLIGKRAERAEAGHDRYRTAWKSARHRAAMYLKSNQNFAASLDNNHAAYLQLGAQLAKSEQGRRNLRGLLEHHRDQGSLGILRTTRTRLARALKACARYRVEVARLTAGQCIDRLSMCQQHHTPPVTGCPYPQCVAARQQQETDHA